MNPKQSHKKQHTIPKSYLKAWCNLSVSVNYEPFVWVFPRSGGEPKPHAPKKIFRETDIYTVQSPTGKRDLRLEHGLASIESCFVTLRQKKLEKRKPLTADERFQVCLFIAAMHSRTRAVEQHHKSGFGAILEMADHMIRWSEQASEGEKRLAPFINEVSTPKDANYWTYEEIKELADHPMPQTLAANVGVGAPLLFTLSFTVLETNDPIGFITSDNPCVWFDPEAYKRPPHLQVPALIYPKIEITLPISPGQMLFLSHEKRLHDHYLLIPDQMLDDLNRRTRFYSYEYFVVNRNYTKEVWFDIGVEPADSWRKTNASKDEDKQDNA